MRPLPKELILVRHGFSVANKASVLANQHDDVSLYTPEFRAAHTSRMLLDDIGIAQAKRTGNWLERYSRGVPFDGHYVTSYVRGLQTAGYLNLPKARWFIEYGLRERDWGEMDHVPSRERRERWQGHMEQKDICPYHWTPIGGESFANAFIRSQLFLEYIAHKHAGQRVVCVGHGEIFQCFRIIIEHISEAEFKQRDKSLRWENCDALIYEDNPRYGLRSSMFRNESGIQTPWAEVRPRGFTSEELLAMTE